MHPSRASSTIIACVTGSVFSSGKSSSTTASNDAPMSVKVIAFSSISDFRTLSR